jgi:hypothetical protein
LLPTLTTSRIFCIPTYFASSAWVMDGILSFSLLSVHPVHITHDAGARPQIAGREPACGKRIDY